MCRTVGTVVVTTRSSRGVPRDRRPHPALHMQAAGAWPMASPTASLGLIGRLPATVDRILRTECRSSTSPTLASVPRGLTPGSVAWRTSQSRGTAGIPIVPMRGCSVSAWRSQVASADSRSILYSSPKCWCVALRMALWHACTWPEPRPLAGLQRALSPVKRFKPRHFSAANARWPIPKPTSTTASPTASPLTTTTTMGVQPQITLPQVQEQVTKPRTGSPLGKHHTSRWHRHHEVPVPVGPLPEEAQQLKEMILRTHKVKLTRFSLSHMKKRVVPPVDIPKEMNSHRALSMTVAGRSVPLTRCMWDNTKRKTHHMEQISESYPLHCTLFR